ncbi:uncharacterized protein LOC124167786 [Ischnura elegans]|uniref:uncharacterized protein LOC124167786 n=1 Tax=Ischnura elegans TaxID=197161 RepID=UPI001ED892B6|nr:uncharacterized protein LOC124167786 [Ischnura elegans]
MMCCVQAERVFPASDGEEDEEGPVGLRGGGMPYPSHHHHHPHHHLSHHHHHAGGPTDWSSALASISAARHHGNSASGNPVSALSGIPRLPTTPEDQPPPPPPPPPPTRRPPTHSPPFRLPPHGKQRRGWGRKKTPQPPPPPPPQPPPPQQTPATSLPPLPPPSPSVSSSASECGGGGPRDGEDEEEEDISSHGEENAEDLDGANHYSLPPLLPPTPPAPAHYISTLRASSASRSPADKARRDPLARLQRFLRAFYRELAGRDAPLPPPWAPHPLPPGALCPANFRPALQVLGPGSRSPERDVVRIDQLFAAVRTSDGIVHEAPRRVVVEGAPGSGKTTLALRLLHAWATQSPDGASGGGPTSSAPLPGVSLALLLPLREMRGLPSLSHFLRRRLLPKAALGRHAFPALWRALPSLRDSLLFVLDGLDENFPGGEDEGGALSDATDLLEGRLLPESRLLLLATSTPPSVRAQRRVLLRGPDPSHLSTLAAAHFAGRRCPELRPCPENGGDAATAFLDAVADTSPVLRRLSTATPAGWLLLASLHEEAGGRLPPAETPPHHALRLLLTALVKRGLRAQPGGEELEEAFIAEEGQKLLEEAGRVSLTALKENRYVYAESELRSSRRGLEAAEAGIFSRGLTFSRAGGGAGIGVHFGALHTSVAEWLAAVHLASMAHDGAVLRRELEALPEAVHSPVLRLLLGLLGPHAHLALRLLCPLDLSPRTVFSLLECCGDPTEENIAAAWSLMGVGGSSAAAVVHSSVAELQGWALVLGSTACQLEALELVFQWEGEGALAIALDTFFAALSASEAVRSVRLSSLLGHEFSGAGVARLASYVGAALRKPKLRSLELVITCLDDGPHERFDSLVDSICAALESGACPWLQRISLDINPGASQVSRLCQAVLRAPPALSALHLPHLRCGPDALRSLAALITARPLAALDIRGSRGSKRDVPDSLCSDDRPGTLDRRPAGHSPRGGPSASRYFSLPRGGLLPRADTLPSEGRDRGPAPWGPPSCPDPVLHAASSGFHAIFVAAREPTSRLRTLNVSRCQLGAEEALCLGETLRIGGGTTAGETGGLDSLRVEGASRREEVLPLVAALGEGGGSRLQLLDLSSPRLTLDDAATQLLCHALARNSSLRLLALEGWTFRIEEEASLSALVSFLSSTSIRDLALANARIEVSVHDGRLSRLGRRDDPVVALLSSLPPLPCPSLAFLRLSGLTVSLNGRSALRGASLLPFLRSFPKLSDLDLSHPPPDAPPLDDAAAISFFRSLSRDFRELRTLRMEKWSMCLEDPTRTIRAVARLLRSCGALSRLRADGLRVSDAAGKVPLEHMFLAAAVPALGGPSPSLSLKGVNLGTAQAASLGAALRERPPSPPLELCVGGVAPSAVRLLAATVEEGGKAEVTLVCGNPGGAVLKLKGVQGSCPRRFGNAFRRLTSSRVE